MNLPLVGVFTRMLAIPMWALMPFVVMISFVGVYSISHSSFDLLVMVVFGVFGFVLRKLDISVVPVVLGLLLGNEMENSLRRAMSISAGDIGILFQSGISIGLYAATAIFLLAAVWMAIRHRWAISIPREDREELVGD
jgi:putative tricarboxylic transport membrane protein